ncbi:type II secretion system protein GspL [Pseudomonas costantinii]|uniref:General secretion pathway protein L n=1 Tax=Pseudomonas costantinii TaxID=168469 RepID=A0A1S2V0G2_9PSED|nr:type II secretion system protein GspL [Pseudomonas costantinii]NVZ21834.1 type II secretion system protein GspL [Pseudomonas costantinii]OIN52184.1 type II secretion system protein GspL [Pseudomonas costantinii]SED35000.1 general secretion pathway protein L [Pseudomonas costantinii]
MKRLRIGLPPLNQLTVESQVKFAWLERGVVVAEGQERLKQLGKNRQIVDCFLHPRDSLLTSLELPPLPSAKTAAAVACAAQALILGPMEQMHVAHGPRESDGRVQVAWVPKAGLERLGQVLAQVPLKLRGLYPAPYALPVATAAMDEGYLLTRHSLQQGAVHPLGQQALDELLDVQLGDEAQRWGGVIPSWGLHGRLNQPATGGWGRALACIVLATAIWTVGLNLYAARQADEGLRIKALMSQQVRQAFPELPVILNPLQQARQQLAARQAGAVADTGQRFTSLLQLAGSNLPFMVGSVDNLTFEQGRLHLGLLADSRNPAVEGDWQAALAQAGFAATRDEQGWTLGPAQAAASAGAEDE